MRTQSLRRDLFGKLNMGVVFILLIGMMISTLGFYMFQINEAEEVMANALHGAELTINDNFLMVLREIKGVHEIMDSLEIYKSNDENMIALMDGQKTLFSKMTIMDALDVKLNSMEKYTVQDLDIYYSDAYKEADLYYFDLYIQWRDRQVITFKVKYSRLFEGLDDSEFNQVITKVLNRDGAILFNSNFDNFVSDSLFINLQDKKVKSIGEQIVGGRLDGYYLSYSDLAVFNQYVLIYVPTEYVNGPVMYYGLSAMTVFLGLTILIVLIVARVNKRITTTLKKLEDKTVSVDALESMGPLEISTYSELSEIYMNFFTLSRELNEREELIKSYELMPDESLINEKHEQDKEVLIKHNMYLKQSLENIQANQEKIVETEKLMALGDLVTGIAHEISTPVGVSYTSASYISKLAKELKVNFEEDEMTKRQFNDFLNATIESSAMICNNLEKASSLVQSFKNEASTQTSMELSEFELCHLIKDVYEGLESEFDGLTVDFKIHCEGYINMYSESGKYRDIFTNLIMNSVIHGFEDRDSGSIEVDITTDEQRVHIQFKDNGKGIEERLIKKIYDPFFTTKRGNGGSGLGLNIVYTLIKNNLKGNINVESVPNVGTQFFIDFPKVTKF